MSARSGRSAIPLVTLLLMMVAACGDSPTGETEILERVPPRVLALEADPVVVWRGGGTLRLSVVVTGQDAPALRAVHLRIALPFAESIRPGRPPQRLLSGGRPVDNWIEFTRDDDGDAISPAAAPGTARFKSPPLQPVEEEEVSPIGTWFLISVRGVRYEFPDTTILVTSPPDSILRRSVYDADREVIPVPAVVDVAPDVRRSGHLVSLAMPRPDLVGTVRPASDIARKYFDHLGHDPDFLIAYPLDSFVHTGGPTAGYARFRNDVEGIGVQRRERGEPGQRLQGMAVIRRGPSPASNYVIIHELLHQWAAYLDSDLGITRSGHWSEELDRPFTGFVDGRYNDLELYLMGLLPPDSVLPSKIATHDLTIGDLIDRHSPRDPAWPETQRQFSSVTLVVYHRLLSAEEMALFDALAAEFGSETPYPDRLTQHRITTFFQATGGRATMMTRIPEDR